MQSRVLERGLWFVLLVLSVFGMTAGHATKPLWTISADVTYPPTVTLTSTSSVFIQYTITNQSARTHTLAMKPIVGITQISTSGTCASSFTLAAHQSCILRLLVNGNTLLHSIYGGPIVCQQGSSLQCYQPSQAEVLNITLIPIARYLITPIADVHGIVTPNSPQNVAAGSTLNFTATPAAGYQIDQWIVDNGIAQKGGSTFSLTNINKNHTVEVTFTQQGTLYAGMLDGSVHYSRDNGSTWVATTSPAVDAAVNGLFATPSTLYAASSDSYIYYSTNNGGQWYKTNSPDSSSVNSIFVTQGNNSTSIYVGTNNGNVFYSIDGGTNWVSIGSPSGAVINGLFITTDNTIYAASNDGNVYYSTNNNTNWVLIYGPEAANSVPVKNIFSVQNQLYVTVLRTSSNSTLPPGTVDFEYTYVSNGLTNSNPSWSLLSQITYTLFVNTDASKLYAGTQNGHVFSLTSGDDLGFIQSSPITSLFFIE